MILVPARANCRTEVADYKRRSENKVCAMLYSHTRRSRLPKQLCRKLRVPQVVKEVTTLTEVLGNGAIRVERSAC